MRADLPLPSVFWARNRIYGMSGIGDGRGRYQSYDQMGSGRYPYQAEFCNTMVFLRQALSESLKSDVSPGIIPVPKITKAGHDVAVGHW